MTAFGSLDERVTEVDLVFFRGTKAELVKACNPSSKAGKEADEITITVLQRSRDGSTSSTPIQQIKTKKGVSVRQILSDNGINVHQSVTRWTNCEGKQLCGTCIVNITEGTPHTNRKSMDEASTLRENPESYRLSCITFAYGDITVETFPPISAAQ